MHVAIKYRQLEVSILVRRLDNDENSILHMVGIKRHDYVPKKMRGPSLELQEGLLWFEVQILVTLLSFVTQAISVTCCSGLRCKYLIVCMLSPI